MENEPVNCTSLELYTYLQGLGEGFLPTYYSDTNPSAPLKLMSIASKSYQRGKKTVHFHGFQSLQMSKHLMDVNGKDWLTASVGVSLAKTLAQQEKAQESQAKEAGYGASSLELLARLCPDTFLWKIPQCSLFEDLEQSLETWPRWGSMQSGVVYRRQTVELGMREIGFGYLLPTINTTGMDGGSNSRRAIQKRLLPTVVKQDMRHATSRHINPKCKHWESKLGEVLVALTGLKKWSPNFAEWLMGWPIGHTELAPLATGRFQEWQQQHLSCLEKD